MPIYKVNGKKKDNKQKYHVIINYKDSYGRYKKLWRTAYGLEEAKDLERELEIRMKKETPAQRKTLQELKDEYISNKVAPHAGV